MKVQWNSLFAIILILVVSGCKVAQVSGTVTLHDTPLANVQVILKGPLTKGGLTDSEGRISFSDLQPGVYTLTPVLEGYAFDPKKRSLVIAGKSSLTVDFMAVSMNPCGISGEEVSACKDADSISIGNAQVRLRYSLETGLYSIYDCTGSKIIENADAVIYSNVLAPAWKWHVSNMSDYSFSIADAFTALGKGKTVSITSKGHFWQPVLTQSFTVLDSKSCVLIDAKVENNLGWDINIGAIYPLKADGLAGRLNFGTSADERVLTNGFLNYLDFLVPIQPGTTPVLSNWSSLIYNQETRRSLSVGFLTYETAQPMVYTGPGPLNEGQTLQAVSQFEPAKKLSPGQGLASETMILDFGQSSPQLALETYADRIKAWLGIRTWLERHPDMKVPVGWNSW